MSVPIDADEDQPPPECRRSRDCGNFAREGSDLCGPCQDEDRDAAAEDAADARRDDEIAHPERFVPPSDDDEDEEPGAMHRGDAGGAW